MTLLDRILARGPTMLPLDPIIAARVERHVRRIQPDPLFRRRVRSVVVNRYVAAREGMMNTPAAHPAMRRPMSALGRGVLYASLLTAVGATAVAAAAQDSLPGDALYGVKLELEQVRMEIAPPNLRDDLAAMALDERLDELERLASAGHWELVDEAAERAAAAERALAAFGADSASGGWATAEDAMQRHTERLEQLLTTAPASAQEGLRQAVNTATGPHEPNDPQAAPQLPDAGSSPEPKPTAPPQLRETTPEPQPTPSEAPQSDQDDDGDENRSTAPDAADVGAQQNARAAGRQ
jgi:hypothetical protein